MPSVLAIESWLLPRREPSRPHRAGANVEDANRPTRQELRPPGEQAESSTLDVPHGDVSELFAPLEGNQDVAAIEPVLATGDLSVIRADRPMLRDRAPRLSSADVPWVSTVKLPWGVEMRLLNISKTGMLVETFSKFTPGTAAEFRLCGPDVTLAVPARFVRSEVAVVDGRGVKYHAAAAFDKELDLRAPDDGGSDVSSISAAVADWLHQLSIALGRDADPATVCERIDQGLRRLTGVRRVEIREAPIALQDGCESVCFTLGKGSGGSGVLQAAFEPGQVPSEVDFKLLQAGAALVAVVLALRRDSRCR